MNTLPARKRTLRTAWLAIAAATLVSGCGAEGHSDPTRAVPASAPLYVEFDADPSEEQQERLEEIATNLPGRGSGSDRLLTLLGGGLSSSGLDVSVADDIQPWVDKRVGLFVSRFSEEGTVRDAALVFSTEDSSKAEQAVNDVLGDDAQESSHRGVGYRTGRTLAGGMVDGLAVVGTVPAIKASIDSSKGRALAESNPYKHAVKRLPKDWVVATFSGTSKDLKRAGLTGPGVDQLLSAFTEPTLSSLRLTAEGLLLESEVPRSVSFLAGPILGGSGTRLLGQLPADAWLAIGQPDIGADLRRLIGPQLVREDAQEIVRLLRQRAGVDVERDILRWMGDGAVFANGLPNNPYNVGLVLESKDPRASTRAIDRLARTIRAGRAISVRAIRGELGVGRGYAFSSPDLPVPIEVLSDRRRVVIAGGSGLAATAILVGTPLSRREEFTSVFARLGKGFQPSTFLIMDRALPTLEFLGFETSAVYRQAEPYLRVIDRIVGGTKPAGHDRLTSRTLITFK